MKKVLPGLFCLLIMQYATAQIINPGDAAKNAGTNKANNNIQSGADKAADKAEGAIKGLVKKKNKPAKADTAVVPAAATSAAATPGIANSNSAPPSAGMRAYNNYDFIPGDTILFEDHFTDDQDGEFPAHWNLGAG